MGSTAELLTLAVVVAIVLGGLVTVIVGVVGIGSPEVPVDASDDGLPPGTLMPADLPRLRFGLALRGYRMAEVDGFVDRVAAELAARDAEVEELRLAAASTPARRPRARRAAPGTATDSADTTDVAEAADPGPAGPADPPGP